MVFDVITTGTRWQSFWSLVPLQGIQEEAVILRLAPVQLKEVGVTLPLASLFDGQWPQCNCFDT